MAKLQSENKIWKLWNKLLKECEENKWLPTKGLWLSKLDITRQTYSRWKKNSDAIKEIDKLIENAWVQRLGGNNVAGIIFYLKNAFGYRDRKEQDIKITSPKPIINLDEILRNNSNKEDSSSK